MLVHDAKGDVSTVLGAVRWAERNVPRVDRHGLKRVVQVEVVGEVVLRSHGFGVVVSDVDATAGHWYDQEMWRLEMRADAGEEDAAL